MGKRYCVFAGYNKENKIGDDVIFYLKELNKITNGVVFIMDNPIDEIEAKKLEGLTIYHKFEKHNEYDFGSYKRGFFYLKENGFLDDTSEIVFANDSCLGPLKPLNLFIEKWEKENKPDFYGITINNYGFKYSTKPIVPEYIPHIQSYFFLVTKDIFEKDFFINFMSSIKHFDNFEEVVKNYEIGLSRLISKNNFKMSAYFNFEGFEKNPSLEGKPMYETIKKGFFIKKKNGLILEKNRNLINYIFSNGIFPYIINKNEQLLKRSKFDFPIIYLLRHYFMSLIKNIFKIKNKDCTKIIIVFGIKFKLKRYKYKIPMSNNNIKIGTLDSEKSLKQRKINGLEIKIIGNNNLIKINKNTKFKNSKIEIFADGCTIEINSEHLVSNLSVKFEKSNYQSLIIDKNTQISNFDIVSNTEDVLIEIKDGKISNNSAKIEKYIDEENRPRIVIGG